MCAVVGDASRHIAELMSNLRADEARLAQSVATESEVLSDVAHRADRIPK